VTDSPTPAAPIAVFEEYVENLERLGTLERLDRRVRHEEVAAASEERCPLWLRLQSTLIVAALDALEAGRDPEMAMGEALATCGASADERERALEQLAAVNEQERRRRKPVPVVGAVYPIERTM